MPIRAPMEGFTACLTESYLALSWTLVKAILILHCQKTFTDLLGKAWHIHTLGAEFIPHKCKLKKQKCNWIMRQDSASDLICQYLKIFIHF